ncbi:MAG: bifunctional 4-hydroxy-2-oxoglutarate aldolase/2-dehydro-3-deoxy-phosphogluconate aldolase [Pseudomonadota bacterium]
MTDLQTLKTALSEVPIVPVLTIERAEDAVPLATALSAGGLTVAEVTLRTSAALPAITAMREAAPDLIVGAGTITELDHVAHAIEAGAEFLVSPGLTPALADALKDNDVPAFPGVATAGEAMTWSAFGFQFLKLFPAVPIGGIGLLKALKDPLPDIQFMPTGGITGSTAPDFLALPNVIAVGGSWMISREDVATGNWTRIEQTVRASVDLGRTA